MSTERPASLRDFERLLRQAGFTRREASAMATAAWGVLTAAPAPAPDADVAAVKAALADVRERLLGHDRDVAKSKV